MMRGNCSRGTGSSPDQPGLTYNSYAAPVQYEVVVGSPWHPGEKKCAALLLVLTVMAVLFGLAVGYLYGSLNIALPAIIDEARQLAKKTYIMYNVLK